MEGFSPERPRAIGKAAEQAEVEVSKEKLEQRRAGIERAATLLWTKAIAEKLPDSLPIARKLGAAFVPSMLFTLASGCYGMRIEDCADDERAFLESTIDWITSHPEEIQKEMNTVWPEQKTDMSKIIDVLNEAKVRCGTQKDWAEAHNKRDLSGRNTVFGTIIIDVHEDKFRNALTLFKHGEWTTEYEVDEIVEMENVALEELIEKGSTDSPFILNDYFSYLQAVMISAETLTHEAAHTPLGKHTKEARMHRHDDYNSTEQSFTKHFSKLDEVYNWGYAAMKAANQEVDTTWEKFDET